MLLQRGGVVVQLILAQSVVVIISGLRIQRRLNGLQAGIGNRRGWQTGILLQVIGRIHGLVVIGNNAGVVGQSVQ